MQHQPPSKNNPSNPLLKVAALTLEREYSAIAPFSLVRILATLNFKHSDDVRGHATLATGESVTVMFSLALKRASFELSFAFENQNALNDVVNILNVAHLSTLNARDRITDEQTSNRQSTKTKSAKANLGIKLGVAGADGKAGGDAAIGRSSTEKTTRRRQVKRSLLRSNISATFGGNLVHWEIRPNDSFGENSEAKGEAWLEGEVFSSLNGKQLDACSISWAHDESKGTPTITGGVFVSIPDLIVENVRLLTDAGDGVSINKIERGRPPGLLGSAYTSLTLTSSKERLVKQVIRKHLVSQGMITEGARVQICRAST